ncbi:MAG: hypothetical protein LW689_06690 [Novosphingobium sp.]|nr:hypothetical protein [Novosphingobium sp.]
MLNEKRRGLLVFNGIGLIATAILSGWFYFFFLLGAIDLWPFVTDVPVNIGGDRRAWNMAHLEGITNGTMLIAIGAAGSYIRLGERAQAVLFWAALAFGWLFTLLFWAALAFGWLFTLPAIANALFGTRGLEFGGGPFPGDVTINNVIFLFGWPAMVGVHVAVALLLWGAWQHHRPGAGQ